MIHKTKTNYTHYEEDA